MRSSKKSWQRGSVTRNRDKWLGLWRDHNGKRRGIILGKISGMTKGQARTLLLQIIKDQVGPYAESPVVNVADFIESSFFPVFRRRWKCSTAQTSASRIRSHVIRLLGKRPLIAVTREELQGFMDQLAQAGYSRSHLAKLRWDLNSIFRFALSEGVIKSNPAEVLFSAQVPLQEKRVMNLRQTAMMLAAFDCREALVIRLATLSGMRPGEIFALQWKNCHENHVVIEKRVYNGEIGTVKRPKSNRQAAISRSTLLTLQKWRSMLPEAEEGDWVFPSEDFKRPASFNAFFRDHLRQRLSEIGLGWVNFQVMRRTHSSLMRERGADPKAVADQLGHTLDVDLNVYTQTSVGHRGQLIELLENAIDTQVKME